MGKLLSIGAFAFAVAFGSASDATVVRKPGLYVEDYSEWVPGDGVIVLRAFCHRCDEQPKPVLRDGRGRAIPLKLTQLSARLGWYAFKPAETLQADVIYTLALPQVGSAAWWPIRVRNGARSPHAPDPVVTGEQRFTSRSEVCCEIPDFDGGSENHCFPLVQDAARAVVMSVSDGEREANELTQFAYRTRFHGGSEEHVTEWDVSKFATYAFVPTDIYCAETSALDLRSGEVRGVRSRCYTDSEVKYPSALELEYRRLARDTALCRLPPDAAREHFCSLAQKRGDDSCAEPGDEACQLTKELCVGREPARGGEPARVSEPIPKRKTGLCAHAPQVTWLRAPLVVIVALMALGAARRVRTRSRRALGAGPQVG